MSKKIICLEVMFLAEHVIEMLPLIPQKYSYSQLIATTYILYIAFI